MAVTLPSSVHTPQLSSILQ